MILKAEHLIKKYKSRTVVKDVSVQVEQGEIVGLLGPNGAGKTTSFYMIVGLITPNGGRIFLDDQEITKEPVYKRAQLGVGYLAHKDLVDGAMLQWAEKFINSIYAEKPQALEE